ncbi:hypothetical protein [Burkholderia stagnalis]|uniref:hypothetical protein n=1 Tax=Burkholderia stagnalis TaxID=1503054 RepID=UPI000AA7D743|nr:hypothetical protein [Burkholderia stagnalis]
MLILTSVTVIALPIYLSGPARRERRRDSAQEPRHRFAVIVSIALLPTAAA